MQSKFISVLRWAGACMMLLLILQLIIEGTWALGWYRSWPFVLTVLCCTILLAAAGIMDWRQRAWMRALNHLGLFCVLLGGMLGAVVEEDVKIVVDSHASERVAYTDQGEARVLPFSLRLADFRIDYYEDGQHPKQYTSSLRLDDNQLISTSVNHPAIVDGWWIYQSDYDRQQSDFVILQLVRDPWLPLVYLGFVLMVLGALWMTIRAWHSWKVLPATLVLACLFGAASLARIELGTLVPALRSLWFFPHILIYMIAYSLLAITLLFALYRLLHKESMVSEQMVERLFATVSALLLVGMLCGAFWAKEAWGHYWTWDAKECWAAVTWLISVMAIHVPQCLANGSNRKAWLTSIFILLTFAAMQVTWYGVNYLPSAAYSLHTYTK